MRAFQFGDQRLASDDPRIGEALAAAHHAGPRPRCLCTQDGVPMYVARLGSAFLLKRMPGTGPLHAPWCPSQGLPILATPLATEADRDPQTETTALTLSFSLTRRGLQTNEPHLGRAQAREIAVREGLTLAALLHYLWNEAELNRWHPSFEGRRSWGTVRRRLLAASVGKTIGTHALRDLLYIPEIFNVERYHEIRFRRSMTWQYCQRSRNGASRLMLLIGELKQLTQTVCGPRVVIKHVPDLPFRVSDQLLRSMDVQSMDVLTREHSDGVHVVVIGTFSIDVDGIPWIEQLDVIPMSARWVPGVADFVHAASPAGRDFAEGTRPAASPLRFERPLARLPPQSKSRG